jgi:phosphohistidine phosphatase
MLLYFLRHGEAVRDSAVSDLQRPLTEAGKKQAAAVGTFLQRNHRSINSTFTSPLARARETGTIVQSFVCAHRFNSTEYLTNGTNQKQLAKLLGDLDVESVLLVGHEPHLSETIAMFLADNRYFHLEMKPCSLALVEIDTPLQFGTGTLQWLIPVDTLV